MFFITCFQKVGRDETGWLDVGACRTFGYRETFQSAKEALECNMCDMHEFLYNFAIVEKLGPYIHPDAEEIHFFKWDKERKGFFEEAEIPNDLKNSGNFAFG